MQLTAEMILTEGGATLALDRGRKDALANYVRRAAWAAGAHSAQRWAEKQWGLQDYEAKHLLKGNASETVWERIVKHPNGGWTVVLPVMGAVIGLSLDQWLSARLDAEERRLSRERERYEQQARQVGEMADHLASLFGLGGWRPGEPSVRLNRESRSFAREMGADGDQPAQVAPRSRETGR